MCIRVCRGKKSAYVKIKCLKMFHLKNIHFNDQYIRGINNDRSCIFRFSFLFCPFFSFFSFSSLRITPLPDCNRVFLSLLLLPFSRSYYSDNSRVVVGIIIIIIIIIIITVALLAIKPIARYEYSRFLGRPRTHRIVERLTCVFVCVLQI